MRKLTKQKLSGTAKADKDKSLFKIMLLYKGKKPNVAYSFDKYGERELFYPGLTQEQRKMWRDFTDAFEDEFYDFFGGCYPEFTKEGVCLHFTNTPTTVDFVKALSDEQRTQLKAFARECGFELRSYHPVAANHKGPRPNVTPKYHKMRDFLNGMTAVKKYYITHFYDRDLIEMRFYDNLAYHSDNLVKVFTFEENLRPRQVEGDPNPPRRLGDSISNFENARR